MRYRVCDRYEFVATALSKDVEVVFGRSGTQGQGASDGRRFECVDYIVDNIFAVVVGSFANTELIDIIVISRRTGDNDSIAGSNG